MMLDNQRDISNDFNIGLENGNSSRFNTKCGRVWLIIQKIMLYVVLSCSIAVGLYIGFKIMYTIFPIHPFSVELHTHWPNGWPFHGHLAESGMIIKTNI